MSTVLNKATREISRLKALDPQVNAYHFAYCVSHADYEKLRAELATQGGGKAKEIVGVHVLGIRVVPVS